MYLIIYIAIGAALYFLGKHFFGTKGDVNSGNNQRILVAAIILTIIISQLKAWFGEQIPGSLLERAKYTTEIYVNLFPERSSSVNYRVPALIEAGSEEYDDGESTLSYRVYRLKHVRFPNGRRITFYNNDEPLKLNEKVYVWDDSGKHWYAELTSDQVPPKK